MGFFLLMVINNIYHQAAFLLRFHGATEMVSSFRLNMRKNFFPLRVTEPWPRLPREVVESPSLEMFQPPGRGAVQPAVGDPASAGGLDWVTHRGPFQPLLLCVILCEQLPGGQSVIGAVRGPCQVGCLAGRLVASKIVSRTSHSRNVEDLWMEVNISRSSFSIRALGDVVWEQGRGAAAWACSCLSPAPGLPRQLLGRALPAGEQQITAAHLSLCSLEITELRAISKQKLVTSVARAER